MRLSANELRIALIRVIIEVKIPLKTEQDKSCSYLLNLIKNKLKTAFSNLKKVNFNYVLN